MKTKVKSGEVYDFAAQPKLMSELATRQNLSYAFLSYLPDPDEVLRKNGKDISVYRSLLIDSQVSANLDQRFAGTKEMQWNLLNDYEIPDAQMDLYYQFLAEIELEDLIEEILFTKYYGFSVFELIWKMEGRFKLPGRVVNKPQEWFFFDDYNRLNIRLKEGSITGQIVDEAFPYQFFLLQNKPTYKNPYGDRIASRIFWHVTFKQGGLKFWTKFIEKYGMGFPIGKYPLGNKQAKDELFDALKVMVQDAVAVIPEGSNIELRSELANSDSAGNYGSFIDFNNKEIAKAILTQTLTTEMDGTGSYSASQTHADMLSKVINADKRFVEKSITRLLKMVGDQNFEGSPVPQFQLFIPETSEIKIKKLQGLKQIGVKITDKAYISEQFGIDEEYFELVEPVINNFPVMNQSEFADASFPDQRAIDEFADFLTSGNVESIRLWERMFTPVLTFIENAKSLTEIKNGLTKQFPKMKDRDFKNYMEKILLIGQLYGEYSDKGGN